MTNGNAADDLRIVESPIDSIANKPGRRLRLTPQEGRDIAVEVLFG